jgi:hypothetical protein
MAKLNIQAIRELARKIVAESPQGIRYSQLAAKIASSSPETPRNSINGAIWDLDVAFPNLISKPSRGLFIAVAANHAESVVISSQSVDDEREQPEESRFYDLFADYLKNDLEEVTAVAALGGSPRKIKWGTPDVVGVYKPLPSDTIQFPKEIITAEIKTNPQESVTAFGQAASYRLFSTKTYIVMPRALDKVESERLEALCMLFGMGLVLFDVDVEKPEFATIIRAQRFSPDVYYVNEFAEWLKKFDKEKFNELF